MLWAAVVAAVALAPGVMLDLACQCSFQRIGRFVLNRLRWTTREKPVGPEDMAAGVVGVLVYLAVLVVAVSIILVLLAVSLAAA